MRVKQNVIYLKGKNKYIRELKLQLQLLCCCSSRHSASHHNTAGRRIIIIIIIIIQSFLQQGRRKEKMAKSKISCFKIMGCGAGSSDGAEDNDHLSIEENKVSSDKRRWSFRKRSTRHRVLSNTVISEPASVCSSKEGLEVMATNFQSPKYSSVPQKVSVQERADETFSPQSATVNSEEVYPPFTNIGKPSIQESDVVVIQACIRGYLAREKFQKIKSAIKLQAVVRGYLVRRKAVGSLRCVLAIVKMQALVRARYAHLSVERVAALEDKFHMDNQRSITSAKEDSGKELSPTEKLLSNGFARQLLESTSMKKSINIKCDPSESDSAWRWMERWMAVTSSDLGQRHEQVEANDHYEGLGGNCKLDENESQNEVPSEPVCLLSDTKFAPSESIVRNDSSSSLTAENVDNFEFQAPKAVSDISLNYLQKDDVNISLLQNEDFGFTQENSTKAETVNEKVSEPLSDHSHLQSNQCSNKVSDSVSDKPERHSPKHHSIEGFTETLETDGNKPAFGLRKSCNPAFAAVQSKFEELSSGSSASRSLSSSYQDSAAKSKVDNQKLLVDSLTTSKEASLTENSVFYDPGVQVAASECGTEISISSTLDSPDRSETEGGEIVLEIGSLDKQKYAINADSDKTFNGLNMDTEVKSPIIDSDALRPQKHEEGDGHLASSIASVDSVLAHQHPAEPTTPDLKTNMESAINEQLMCSPDGTPRSHAIAHDLHGTPQSQISVNAMKTKKDTNLPTQKERTQLATRKSPSNLSNDSGGKSSVEHAPKDAKNAKRRNSFGMSKPDHVDQEARTCSSSSLPSYMQATVSARAKAHANASPKLSPDLHENHTKKRHSLPTENGKQGSSPRMQRSASQAQQNTKANGTNSPHNIAERRWQR